MDEDETVRLVALSEGILEKTCMRWRKVVLFYVEFDCGMEEDPYISRIVSFEIGED